MDAWIRGSSPPSKKSKGPLERQAALEKYRMGLSQSVRKSGLQSDDPPSKLGLESVSPPSKIERERLYSVSKNGPESVDSPSKDGLESFKSLPKSDPVPHGDSTYTINPEIDVTILIHDTWGAPQRSCDIRVDQDTTILELTHRVQRQFGVPLDQVRLFHDGSILQHNWDEQEKLSACGINKNTIMILILNDLTDGRTYLPKTSNTTTHVETTNEVQTTPDDYDEDLYIVDPQAHFDMLSQLERNVLQRSEYFKTKREYCLSTTLDPVNDDGAFLDEIGLRVSLTRKIRGSSIVTRTIQKWEPSSAAFWHLLKSYSIVLNASRSMKQMVNLHFCKNAINILVFHELPEVIEIRRVPSALITVIEEGLEAALSLSLNSVLLVGIQERSFVMRLTDLVMPPCRRLLERVGSYVFPAPATRTLSELATAVRVVALVIDVGLVSYVRSHGSGFDNGYFSNELNQLEVNLGDKLIFGCYWAKLACLHSFLDTKKVWVFDFSGIHKSSWQRKLRRHSLCARMEDIADIWGPVYTVPTGTGTVKYYGVSKGIIYRVKSKEESPIPGAKLCHYSSRSSFVRKNASGLLAYMHELALSQDDLLLIGAGFCENANCNYTMSAFTEESTSAMTVLGTKSSVWNWDSRGFTIGLSKYLGVTVSGTQKRIPQTTLKQHILDSWTTVPSRRNPAVLNQYLGVEISHCTGNARRISLKTLMISRPVWPILERQIPDWHHKPWGEALNKALHSPDKNDIVNVWNQHESNRSDIADLVCCVLQVLNDTGLNEQKVFNSAVLIDNEEWAVSVPGNLNSWLVALEDTHLTSAYVLTNEICLGCEVPDLTISTCKTSQAFTALQTQITTEESPSDSKAEYLLQPFGERYRRTECGSSSMFLLSPKSGTFARISLRMKSYECSEILNNTKPGRFRNAVYLRASTRSYHGRYEVKDTIVAKLSSSLRQYRNVPDHDRNIDTDEPNSQLQKPANEQGGLQLARRERAEAPRPLPQESQTKYEICVLTRETGPALTQARRPLAQTGLHEEVSSMMNTSTTGSENSTRLTNGELSNTGVPGPGASCTYSFNSLQADFNLPPPRRTIRSPDVRSSCPATHAVAGTKFNGILDNMANYSFYDEDDSDPDHMITPQPQRLPAGYTPGGWI